MSDIYDGAFRTILNDCRKLVIPVINEIFGENYTGNEKIEFFPNEHFIDQRIKRIRNESLTPISGSSEQKPKNTIWSAKAAIRTAG